MDNKKPPVVTIDGPSGVGKGTIAQLLAKKLHWHYLDSGILYRVFAWSALQENISVSAHDDLQTLFRSLKIELKKPNSTQSSGVICNGVDVTNLIRTEECSRLASQLSALPFVREMLLDRQKTMRQWPGLVTDGRDMGTVIFPDADVKFFFMANLDERAKRRYNQLKEKKIDASLRKIREEMVDRDSRDASREIAPAKPAEDAVLVDTSELTIDQVLEFVLKQVQQQLISKGVPL
jgi:cytidylate kinase